MRRYRVLAKSFIGGSLVEPGEIVSLPDDQPAGSHLEPIDGHEDAVVGVDRSPLPIPKRKLPTKE